MKPELSVRPYQLKDIPNIVRYFTDAEDDFLVQMGADPQKIPSFETWKERLEEFWHRPPEKMEYFYMIWELDGRAIGHNNINQIEFGQRAFMHLHIWDAKLRRSGHGSQFLKMSIPVFFEKAQLQELFCEPMADNQGPNKTLAKLGFQKVKTYHTTPGFINLPQTVNRFVLTKEQISKW